jgi:hypothetical protein
VPKVEKQKNSRPLRYDTLSLTWTVPVTLKKSIPTLSSSRPSASRYDYEEEFYRYASGDGPAKRKTQAPHHSRGISRGQYIEKLERGRASALGEDFCVAAAKHGAVLLIEGALHTTRGAAG